MTAPSRPAPMPKPGWMPWASAELVVTAMLPVAARAATATAAILVLIDMEGNSVRVEANRYGPHVPIGRRHPEPGSDCAHEIFVIRIPQAIPARCGDGELHFRLARKRLHIEFIDIAEQFDEPARAVLDQA